VAIGQIAGEISDFSMSQNGGRLGFLKIEIFIVCVSK